MHTDVHALFHNLWRDYTSITPSADAVHKLLSEKTDNDTIINDHVAFRTFNLPKVSLHKLAAHFEALGYVDAGDYNFEAKKLTAKHYQHTDPALPKVFISELRVEELSERAQRIIHTLVDKMPEDAAEQNDFLYSGPHWQVSKQDYEALLEESEYAAWMSVWGYRANHFTVSVNHLQGGDELTTVNQLLKDAGFELNTSGGEIKGGADVCLAQSSTMADKMPVELDGETLDIPSCFYEFAQRYTLADGSLYQGFVAASADKIFESTNAN